MDEEEIDVNVAEEDYYTFLNVPRNATNEEINNSYRRLSRLYHPDKHLDPDHKKAAEDLFNKTKKAYEVLSDPHQRAIYDNLGIKGLTTEGWEIVQRTKTPQEIREEYERLAREREEQRLQQRTNPKGNVTVNINATDIFSRYEDEYEELEEARRFPVIEVSGMSFTQSIEAPITLRDTISLSGQLQTHNGNGSGSVNISARRLLSERGWMEADFSVGSGPVFSLKGFRTLTKRTFISGATTLQFSSIGIRPGFYSTLAMQLDKQMVGYLTWRAGAQSSMSTAVVRDTPNSHTAFTIQLGVPHSFISLSYTHKMAEKEMKLRVAVKGGTFGAIMEYGAEKKVSQHSSLAASVSFGVPIGVALKFKVTRASQVYSFPIHLCEEILPSPLFYATVAPILMWAVVKKLVIDPIVKEQNERERDKQKEIYKSRMAEKRKEALSSIELMRATYSRICSDEEAKQGLIIEKALYGCQAALEYLREGEQTQASSDVIDVTIPVQCLVKDSKLVVHESSKSQLPGFYDPCVGEDKSLLIQYLYHNNKHEVVIADTDALRLPKHTHRVNGT